eukprot:TRINITY_DN12252_c0_g1_i1.p1 TRINITY_DN12252_c0_g1~~TRINITY_DN12252_c0_g1_i1.p1  ORF type:complete len:130 (-),score=13.56 TRINITY_DN12252_c0_g1_i1:64-453(-)
MGKRYKEVFRILIKDIMMPPIDEALPEASEMRSRSFFIKSKVSSDSIVLTATSLEEAATWTHDLINARTHLKQQELEHKNRAVSPAAMEEKREELAETATSALLEFAGLGSSMANADVPTISLDSESKE